ncbi:MAG: carotenoid oxygenase family protein [Coxiellaceae bacterium]|nr:carotenoid oxygenase family protein [Coxiellaceae bacterium]
MIKILLGFLPWIAYFLLSGPTQSAHLMSLSVALGITVLLDRKELKKGFILTWGGFLFFAGLLCIALFTDYAWPMQHASLLGNTALMLIVWISLILKKPFTLQYARETIEERFWGSPLFIQINNILTIVWGLSFTLLTAMSLGRHYFELPNSLIYQISTYLPTLFAIWFTQKFPDWYQEYFSEKQIKLSEEKQKNNVFLQGNFSPVFDELSVDQLPIVGKLPEDLCGVYMRNGPNPQFSPFSYTFPFDGDGMIHAVYFEKGDVTYKNRFIVTDQLKVERRFGEAVYGGIDCPVIRSESKLAPSDSKMPVKIGRFIHIIRQANTYLAMHESTSAYEITRELDTVGEWNPTNATLPVDVNAHTRVDPDTGERFFISYSEKPIITYLVLDKFGKVSQQGEVAIPYSCMVHDFVMTKNHLVIFLCPAILDLFGKNGVIEWKPEYKTKIVILNKNALSTVSDIIETEAFYTFHFANAYEIDEKIIVDHMRYDNMFLNIENASVPNLYRSCISLKDRQCAHEKLDNRNVEFPRINDHFDSKPYSYIYAALNTCAENGNTMQAIIKYDMKNNTSTIHDFGECEVDEPVFVAKKNAIEEDDGYVLCFVFCKKTNSSELVILDAKSLSERPISTVKMPQRIPHGLHGSWFPLEKN